MRRFELLRNGTRLFGTDTGSGAAVLFQHGLGGDEAQVADAFPTDGFRRLTLECRGQGVSEAGDPSAFAISTFADDVLAFAHARGVARFAMGGISMGAAIALRIAVNHPEQVTALILARPAWLWGNAPQNMQFFAELSRHIATGRRDEFEVSKSVQLLAREAPDNLASMRNFFDRPDSQTIAQLLAAIAADGPGATEADIRSIKVPTLVLACAMDWIHPISLARTLSSLIPSAKFVEITPKAKDKARHLVEFRTAVTDFLRQVEPNR